MSSNEQAAPPSDDNRRTRVQRGTNADQRTLEPRFARSRLLSVNLRDADMALEDAQCEARALREEAQRIRTEAQAEIDAARAALAEEADTIRRQALEDGIREGRTAWAERVAALDQEMGRIQAEIPGEIQSLALLIARRIIDVEFSLNPRIHLDLIRNVLSTAKLYREIVVVVHPDDYAVVTPHADDLKRGLLATESFQIRSDPEVPRHGVWLLTNRGLRDGSVDTQLDLIARQLAESEIGVPDEVEHIS
jgi:flagellar biosynthesis/type III secretory pathway protein FliH